jgi:hypothetical protein
VTVGLSTNWATLAGSSLTNQFVMPIGTTNGSVFFRMIYPQCLLENVHVGGIGTATGGEFSSLGLFAQFGFTDAGRVGKLTLFDLVGLRRDSLRLRLNCHVPLHARLPPERLKPLAQSEEWIPYS